MSAAVSLNRTNCLALLLNAFASNTVVKALVILPAVSDDFYLTHRNEPLSFQAENLLVAITALTNATALRVAFKSGFLLLHLDQDRLEPTLIVKNKATAERLKHEYHLPHTLWIDTHWERVQPQLHALLNLDVRPTPPSKDAWHFARHNLAAWNLADWDVLAALSLTGKTSISVQRKRLLFTTLRD